LDIVIHGQQRSLHFVGTGNSKGGTVAVDSDDLLVPS
jgi:hypothetical protein